MRCRRAEVAGGTYFLIANLVGCGRLVEYVDGLREMVNTLALLAKNESGGADGRPLWRNH